MKKLSLPIISLILFVEGFAGLSYQMLYIRQLTPVLGNNITIVSWIVGVFLLFLAIGYRQGGIYKGDTINRLVINFLLSAIISGIGLSSFFILFYFEILNVFAGDYLLLIGYAFLIVAPTSFLLGQTIPLITNHMPESTVSKVSGDVLFLSTIGSFLGAIVGTNILINYLGVASTIFITTFALIALAFMLKTKVWPVALILTPVFFILNVQYENDYYIQSNEYSNYRVQDFRYSNTNGRFFMANGSYSSFIGNEGEKVGYIKTVEDILFKDMKLENKDILVLGAGGFVISHGISNNNFTYVDIDPEIKEIAEEHFLREPINGEFIGEDARKYLLDTDKKHDVVFLDAYTGTASIPEHLSTIDFFKLVKEKTKEDGIVVINSIADFEFNETFSKNFRLTVNQVFPYCYVTPNTFGVPSSVNIVYICFNKDNDKIYTDDMNNSGKDYWDLYIE